MDMLVPRAAKMPKAAGGPPFRRTHARLGAGLECFCGLADGALGGRIIVIPA